MHDVIIALAGWVAGALSVRLVVRISNWRRKVSWKRAGERWSRTLRRARELDGRVLSATDDPLVKDIINRVIL